MAEQGTRSSGAGDLAHAGTVQNPGLAEQARTRLEEAGIHATLRAHPHIPAHHDMELAGQVAIMVPAGKVQEARRILGELASDTDIPLDDEDEAGG